MAVTADFRNVDNMALLRNVETHVRVMAERDNLVLSEKGVNFQPLSLPYLTHGGQFSQFNRVHKEKENSIFFDAAMRKIVASAIAGQSHTVLICGPPQSGRSQTMYDVQDAGLVNLTAKALLQIPDVVVHFTAFNVRGQNLYDSFNGREIQTVDLPAPVGPMPLSTVRLLETPREAVVVPTDKRVDTSCFISFQIYRPITSSGTAQRREAFSTITFVDLCTFTETLTADLHNLSYSIDRVLMGSDPRFDSCRLTQLLEHSIKGGRTLTAICAITGSKETAGSACTALDLLERLGKIGQIAPLCQMVPPRWFDELPRGMEVMEQGRLAFLDSEYQRGVLAVYEKIRDVLSVKHRELRTEFHADSAFEDARRRLSESLKSRLALIQDNSSVHHEAHENLQQELRRYRNAAEDLERKCAQNQRLISTEEQNLRFQVARHDEVSAAAQLQLSRLENERNSFEARLRQIHQATQSNKAALAESDTQTDNVFDRIRRITLVTNRTRQVEMLEAKRSQLQTKLADLSSQAANLFCAGKEDQLRKSTKARASRAAAAIGMAETNSPRSDASPHSRGGKKSRSRAFSRLQSNAASSLL